MKNFILLLFLFNPLSSFTQEVPLDFQKIIVANLEPGKCYFTKLLEEKESKNQTLERPFILEVFPPLYEEVELAISLQDFKSQLEINRKHVRHQISPTHLRLIRKELDFHNFNTKTNPNSFAYCIVEVPAQYKVISEKLFIEESITITERELVEESKVIKTYVDAKPANLTENQSFFQGGYWSTLEEVRGSRGCGGSRPIIREIQKALRELGYDLELNNILDEKTKNALTHFQRKNGLVENQIDLETIKKLGVEY